MKLDDLRAELYRSTKYNIDLANEFEEDLSTWAQVNKSEYEDSASLEMIKKDFTLEEFERFTLVCQSVLQMMKEDAKHEEV